MAIPNEFINKMTTLKGLRANKDYTRFFYRFKVNGQEFNKIIDYSQKTWSKKDRKTNATAQAIKYKREKIENDAEFTTDTKFVTLVEAYIKNNWGATLDGKDWVANTNWGNEKITMLNHYIYPQLKNKTANAIREVDIDKIRTFMEHSGYGKQNQNGCSPRTIRKVLLQVLKPILEYGVRNGAINRMPKIKVPDKPKKKKVDDGTKQLSQLYKTLFTLYKDNPFYRALFLFALFGRRWNEIRTLEWTDIDFDNSKYTIRAENSKINEDKTFVLPHDIREALNAFREGEGLVFVSPVTGKELTLPKKQIQKIKEASGIERLTLHYFRHIMATALQDVGMENTIAVSLGHNNPRTAQEYYITQNSLKGSLKSTKAIEDILDVEVVE